MEYSKNFDFFIEHQIAVSITNNKKHYTFFSRLEKRCFKVVDGSKELSEDEMMEICKNIHNKLFLCKKPGVHLIPVHINKARDDEYFWNWCSEIGNWVRGEKIPEHLKKSI